MSIIDIVKNITRKNPTGVINNAVENPYLAAQRIWNEQSAANTASRQMWQLVGIISLMIAVGGVGGAIYIGSQSKFVPYVVEVTKLGQTAAVMPADKAQVADPRVVHSAVAAFVNDIRTVTPDVAIQRKAIFRVYAMLNSNDPATFKSNDFLNGNEEASPFKRAQKEMVSVEMSSVLPQTSETWQVDWVETVRDRQGIPKGAPFRMRALVTVYTLPPTSNTTETQIRNNPLGIYVRDFSWAKQV